MIIKEAEYSECEACGNRHRIACRQLVCDICGNHINEECFGGDVLEITTFPADRYSDSMDMHFCSWKCVFKALPNISTDYFIDLPCITAERLEEFKAAFKEICGVTRCFHS